MHGLPGVFRAGINPLSAAGSGDLEPTKPALQDGISAPTASGMQRAKKMHEILTSRFANINLAGLENV